MIDVVEIKDKDGRMTLTVKRSFLEKCPEPSKFTLMELNKDYNMMTYLHNEAGPALIQHKGPALSKEIKELIDTNKYLYTSNDLGRTEYWIDGHCVSREDVETAKKMHHNIQFNTKFDQFLGESDDSRK